MLLRRRRLPIVLLLRRLPIVLRPPVALQLLLLLPRRHLLIAPCHVRRRLPIALAPAAIGAPESCLVVFIPALLVVSAPVVVIKVLKVGPTQGVLRCESIVD